MGNRAVIAFSQNVNDTGIYVHWNGGPESVLAFLAVCKQRGYRTPAGDKSYAMARLVQVICEFFPGDSSVGVGPLCELDIDNYDNGAYLVGGNWVIESRWGEGSDHVKTVDALDSGAREQYDGMVAQFTATAAA